VSISIRSASPCSRVVGSGRDDSYPPSSSGRRRLDSGSSRDGSRLDGPRAEVETGDGNGERSGGREDLRREPLFGLIRRINLEGQREDCSDRKDEHENKSDYCLNAALREAESRFPRAQAEVRQNCHQRSKSNEECEDSVDEEDRKNYLVPCVRVFVQDPGDACQLGRLRLEQPRRYERARPGELVHIDIKKLGRIPEGGGHRIHGRGAGKPRNKSKGWDFVHVCVDDATRIAYVEILDDERAVTAIEFLERAVAHFAARGVIVRAVMTDNGSAYVSQLHTKTCARLGLRHHRTRPYRPRTNGKAERFIQTLLNGWAYAAAYYNSMHRAAALEAWIDFYNHRRPHGSLSKQAPATRLAELLNNPAGNYS
jgi:transposase InsO family protein